MPLGLMPGMMYEEKEAMLAPGESVLLHSDGLVEAHNTEREMFGFPRLMRADGRATAGGGKLIDEVLAELDSFTGPGWEQEDDITLVVLRRAPAPGTRLIRERRRPDPRRVRLCRASPGTSGW